MELVVDANVLVAGFLRSATTRELLLDERLGLWVPEHGLTEASAYQRHLSRAQHVAPHAEDAPTC